MDKPGDRKDYADPEHLGVDPEAVPTGENPARFLEQLTKRPNFRELSDITNGRKRELIEARIRGIDSLETARAWLAVEAEIAGREWVIEALNRRVEYLKEHGDRADRLERQERRDPEPTASVAEVADGVPFDERGGLGHQGLLEKLGNPHHARADGGGSP